MKISVVAVRIGWVLLFVLGVAALYSGTRKLSPIIDHEGCFVLSVMGISCVVLCNLQSAKEKQHS